MAFHKNMQKHIFVKKDLMFRAHLNSNCIFYNSATFGIFFKSEMSSNPDFTTWPANSLRTADWKTLN